MSGFYARERISMLLLSERMECSPYFLQMIKNDFIYTIKKYARIEDESAKLMIDHKQTQLRFEVSLKREAAGIKRDYKYDKTV